MVIAANWMVILTRPDVGQDHTRREIGGTTQSQSDKATQANRPNTAHPCHKLSLYLLLRHLGKRLVGTLR